MAQDDKPTSEMEKFVGGCGCFIGGLITLTVFGLAVIFIIHLWTLWAQLLFKG